MKGISVLATYANLKSYKIADIDFNKNPTMIIVLSNFFIHHQIIRRQN